MLSPFLSILEWTLRFCVWSCWHHNDIINQIGGQMDHCHSRQNRVHNSIALILLHHYTTSYHNDPIIILTCAKLADLFEFREGLCFCGWDCSGIGRRTPKVTAAHLMILKTSRTINCPRLLPVMPELMPAIVVYKMKRRDWHRLPPFPFLRTLPRDFL